jgi:type IV pilus assembly protein PilF
MAELSYDQGEYISARGYLQRYLELTTHTPKSLWLGIRIEQELGDKNAVSSYALLLRNNYPDTKEAALLNETGTR